MLLETFQRHLYTDLLLSMTASGVTEKTLNTLRQTLSVYLTRFTEEGFPLLDELTDTYKDLMGQLCASGDFHPSSIRLSQEAYDDIRSVDPALFSLILGFFSWPSKLAPTGVSLAKADYQGFIARSLETQKLGNLDFESILPISSSTRREIARLTYTARDALICKHGPGATAEKLRTWDKWLAILEEDRFPPRPVIRMTDVPKDRRKRRLIGIEHAGRQFAQQGIASFLRGTPWFRNWVRLEDQEKHIRFAAHRTAAFTSWPGDYSGNVTIDLSDASDRIPCGLVEHLLPDLYPSLADCSSSYALIKDELHELGMMATMGNGFCFELETLVFHIVCALVGRSENGNTRSLAFYAKRCRVYGDDIIVPEAWYPAIELTFARLGWRISVHKTGLTPSFLETCGSYIWSGVAIKRYCPTLAYTPERRAHQCHLTWESQVDRLAAANACVESGFPFLGAQLARSVLMTAMYRWNFSLQRHEIKLTAQRAETRPLSVLESTRLEAYWRSGLVDQRDEDTGTSRVKATWVPSCEYTSLLRLLRFAN